MHTSMPKSLKKQIDALKNEQLPHDSELEKRAKRQRDNPTNAETRLIKTLHALGIDHVRSQVVIASYIVDIVLPRHNLLIEVDGAYHDEPYKQRCDKLRDTDLRRCGFYVARIRNEHTGSYEMVREIIDHYPASKEAYSRYRRSKQAKQKFYANSCGHRRTQAITRMQRLDDMCRP